MWYNTFVSLYVRISIRSVSILFGTVRWWNYCEVGLNVPLYFAVVETTLLGDTIARAFSSFQILSVLCMNSRFFSARETIEQLVRNQSEIPESMPISQPVCVSSVFHRFNIDTASPSFSLVPRSISLRSFEGLDNRARTKEELSLSLSLSLFSQQFFDRSSFFDRSTCVFTVFIYYFFFGLIHFLTMFKWKRRKLIC